MSRGRKTDVASEPEALSRTRLAFRQCFKASIHQFKKNPFLQMVVNLLTALSLLFMNMNASNDPCFSHFKLLCSTRPCTPAY